MDARISRADFLDLVGLLRVYVILMLIASSNVSLEPMETILLKTLQVFNSVAEV